MAKEKATRYCSQIENFKVRYKDEKGKLKFDGKSFLENKDAKARLAELKKQHLEEKRKCTGYTVKKIYVGGHVTAASKPAPAEKKPSKKEGSDK